MGNLLPAGSAQQGGCRDGLKDPSSKLLVSLPLSFQEAPQPPACASSVAYLHTCSFSKKWTGAKNLRGIWEWTNEQQLSPCLLNKTISCKSYPTLQETHIWAICLKSGSQGSSRGSCWLNYIWLSKGAWTRASKGARTRASTGKGQ